MKVNKKAIALSALALMLLVTGYINYVGESDDVTASNTDSEYVPVGEAKMVSSSMNSSQEEDYFKKARINRETERSKSIDLLNDTVNNSNSTPEAKNNAQNQLSRIADNIEIEANTEGLITAKGYRDAVVYIGDSSVNVVVACDELTAADTAKIRDIVYEQTKNNNIKIVAVK